MATLNNNAITALLSGMVGGALVFRRYGNKVVVSAAPAKRKVISEAQKAQQRKFKEAVIKARALLQDPIYYAQCKAKAKPTQTVLNVAVRELLINNG